VKSQYQLTLPQRLLGELLQFAATGHPLEIGGLIAVRSGAEPECIPLQNALASPFAYRSDPTATIAAAKRMRERGEEVLAVYHSHPSSAPVPSRRDLAERYGRVPTLIIGEGTIRGWSLSDDSFEEIELLFTGDGDTR
jgi:[CysO sulfur-carrier protein]-S-L-cysteine hydrolase